jgi:hypothetical protein
MESDIASFVVSVASSFVLSECRPEGRARFGLLHRTGTVAGSGELLVGTIPDPGASYRERAFPQTRAISEVSRCPDAMTTERRKSPST